jgi:hypothetical protein
MSIFRRGSVIVAEEVRASHADSVPAGQDPDNYPDAPGDVRIRIEISIILITSSKLTQTLSDEMGQSEGNL